MIYKIFYLTQKYFIILSILFTLSYASQNFECNETTCPKNQGECINNLCLCAPGYITFLPKNFDETKDINNIKLCNYAYKYKTYAIVFEMLFPFGLGHLYAHRYFHALIKFLLFWILSINKVLFKKKMRGYPQLIKVLKILQYIFLFLYGLDYFGFFFDYYKDGNKISLLS